MSDFQAGTTVRIIRGSFVGMIVTVDQAPDEHGHMTVNMPGASRPLGYHVSEIEGIGSGESSP